jgi:prevent-host-death family protein
LELARQPRERLIEKWLADSYFCCMRKHGVAEAKNQLSKLIDRALKGEGVVITRHGRPVVELKPILPMAKAPTPESVDWLVRRRVGRRMPREDAAALVRRMRDEWEL